MAKKKTRAKPAKRKTKKAKRKKVKATRKKQPAKRNGKPAKRRAKTEAPERDFAEIMAEKQREISVSEFFAKNRHLLGFDNPRKALLTTVKEAVDNALTLFDASKKAGIKRVVHISITNPSEDSPYEYFRGKAEMERALKESGLSYAILRPAVLFGKEDILINNIAWFVRNFPMFGMFGDGEYRLQPIYVDDLAKLAVERGQKGENCVIDAIGPETFTYRELIEEISLTLGKSRFVFGIPPSLGYCIGKMSGYILGDVTITWDEIGGLMDDLLYTESPPAGETKLTDWLKEHASSLGMRYHNELARRKNREMSYEELK